MCPQATGDGPADVSILRYRTRRGVEDATSTDRTCPSWVTAVTLASVSKPPGVSPPRIRCDVAPSSACLTHMLTWVTARGEPRSNWIHCGAERPELHDGSAAS